MIILDPIIDPWEVKRLLTRDNIYINCYQVEDLYSENIDFNTTIWFRVLQNDKEVGLVFIKEFCGKCVSFHGGIYKEHRKNSLTITKDALNKLKEMGCKLITTISSNNIITLKFIKKLDFECIHTIKEGCSDNSNLLIFAEIE